MALLHSYLYLISAGAFVLPSYAYTITTDTTVDQPKAGDNLFYDIKLGPSDTVTIVDIHLADGSRGNSTLIFGSSDLKKSTDASAGFPIPVVPPGTSYTVRILNASNKNRLADSASFQIFAGDVSATSIPPATLPSAASTSLPTTQSPTPTPANNNVQPTAKKSTPIGPIIGGVLGGLLAVVLLLLALLLLGRRNKKRRLSYYESRRHKPRPITPPPNGEVKPFVLLPPEPISSDTESTAHTSTLTATTGNRTTMSEKARLAQAQARTRSHGDISSMQTSTASPSSAISLPSRADELRVERDRLNRMIANLENRTVSSPSTAGGMSTYTLASSSNQSGGSSGDSRDHHLAEQVAALREQIQRMEARQAQQPSPQHFSSAASNSGFTDYEPPPGYDGPPSSTHPTAALTPETTTARAADVDRKDPI